MEGTFFNKYCRASARWSAFTVVLMLFVAYGYLAVVSNILDINLKQILNTASSSQEQASGKGTVEKFFNGTADDDTELVEYIRDHKIIPPSKEPYNLHNPQAVDSSQFGQTIELDKMLRNMTHGFFVEVGAYDGEFLSNSLFFERYRNWTGLLIEAGPTEFETLKTKNRKAYAINACLSLSPKAEMLYFISGGVLGRIAPNGYNAGNSLQCVPLYTLLLALGRTQIDLFSLDIEGDELKVLKTVPWHKMQIRLMVVEFNHIKEGKEAVIEYMQDVGYTLVKVLEIDLVFAKKELLDEAGN